jgi:ADP-ribosyl-[dinitrogen reductase] hydrolase
MPAATNRTAAAPPPLSNSYWVVPGQVLAGEYPAGPDPEKTRERLQRLLDAGIECFIDLTQPEELPPYQESLPNGIDYLRRPIQDHALPGSPDQMMRVLESITESLRAGRPVYVHCRAGIGRTGTAMGCLLVERGFSGEQALEELNHLWQKCKRSVSWPFIPETDEQASYVRNWSASLSASVPAGLPSSLFLEPVTPARDCAGPHIMIGTAVPRSAQRPNPVIAQRDTSAVHDAPLAGTGASTVPGARGARGGKSGRSSVGRTGSGSSRNLRSTDRKPEAQRRRAEASSGQLEAPVARGEAPAARAEAPVARSDAPVKRAQTPPQSDGASAPTKVRFAPVRAPREPQSEVDPLFEPATLAAARGLRGRFLGALLGLAVGDAVAAATQFKRRNSFTPVGDMLGGGPFDLPRGGWSDDTSMALCLAESLLACNGFDARDQVQRYTRWQQDGHLSATGQCLGITANTARALAMAKWRRQVFPGSHDPDQLDIEPLSRIAPAVMFSFASAENALQHAADAARITCQAPIVLDACRSLARVLHAALAGHPKTVIIAAGPPLTESAGRSNGTAPAALTAALWAFASTDNFRDAVLRAANLGGNSDVVTAVCGQIAGAHYSVGALPSPWRNTLMHKDVIENFADRLLQVALVGLSG